jgi:hypothetical protein
MSYTTTYTFTRSNAEYVGSKIVADLRQMNRWLGKPSEDSIEQYRQELVELLPGRYIEAVTYGLRKNSQWVAALSYVAKLDGSLVADDRSGGLSHYASIDKSGTVWGSFLVFSSAWHNLSSTERGAIQERLPFIRVGSEEPGSGLGYWTTEKTYSANGSGVLRKTFRPY